MSTTPQGSTLNQDKITLSLNKSSTGKSINEQDYSVIDGDSDCRRSEAFDLPTSKKFKSSTSLISNGNESTSMTSNGNGENAVEAMEHTNGGMNHNGVCV
jgi:hypothetical protein